MAGGKEVRVIPGSGLSASRVFCCIGHAVELSGVVSASDLLYIWKFWILTP